jgi:hypothetical protein
LETFQNAIIRDNAPITVDWRKSELGKLRRRYMSWFNEEEENA